MQLKQEIFYKRASIRPDNNHPGWNFLPVCANCNEPVYDPSMHEWLFKRGDVDGAAFEDRMQIYVAPNVVLACETGCHQELQFGEEGRLKCLQNIKQYITYDEMTAWLMGLPNFSGKTQEALRWVEEKWNE
jgi:hypothetical protein